MSRKRRTIDDIKSIVFRLCASRSDIALARDVKGLVAKTCRFDDCLVPRCQVQATLDGRPISERRMTDP